jgi:hypothetical protein
VADPPSPEIATPPGCAAEPDRESPVQNETTPPAVDPRIPPNRATPPDLGERMPPNEPTAPRRTIAPAGPALAFALVMLLVMGISGSLAGAFDRPSGGPRIRNGAPGWYRDGAGQIQNEPSAAGWADDAEPRNSGRGDVQTGDPARDRQRSRIAGPDPPGPIDPFPSSAAGARISATPASRSEPAPRAPPP